MSFRDIKDLIQAGIVVNTQELGSHASAVETAGDAVSLSGVIGETVSDSAPLMAPGDESVLGVSENITDKLNRVKRILGGGVSAMAINYATLEKGMSYTGTVHDAAERAVHDLGSLADAAEIIVAKTVSLGEPADRADGLYRKATEGSDRYDDLTTSAANHAAAAKSFGGGLVGEAAEKIGTARDKAAQAVADAEVLRERLAADREESVSIASALRLLEGRVDAAIISAQARGTESQDLRGLLEQIVGDVKAVETVFDSTKKELEETPLDPHALIKKAEEARDSVG